MLYTKRKRQRVNCNLQCGKQKAEEFEKPNIGKDNGKKPKELSGRYFSYLFNYCFAKT